MSSATDILMRKRLQGELLNIQKNREAYYQIIQDTENQCKFYFLITGDSDTAYKGGYYIGIIEIPKDYPINPGNFYMLTPSGRFDTNKKICLTNSSYHKESWSPSWNLQTMVIGFVSIFGDDETSGISHIKESPELRKEKAKNSISYNMTHHKDLFMRFTQFVKPDGTIRTDDEVKQWVEENKPKKKGKLAKAVKTSDSKTKTKTETNNSPIEAEVEKKDTKIDDVIVIGKKSEPNSPSANASKTDQQKLDAVALADEVTLVDEVTLDPDNSNTHQEKLVNEVTLVNSNASIAQESVVDKVALVDEVTTITNKKSSSKKVRSESKSEKVKISVKKQKNYPQNYAEWRKVIENSTIKDFDHQLFSMVF